MSVTTKKISMYLDQNALDELRKKGTDAHLLTLKDNYNFVYSNSTLREIHKAGINARDTEKIVEFIVVLTMLDATYLQLPDISYNFDARPYECHDKPLDVYLRFLGEDLLHDKFIQNMEKIGLAIHNGVMDYDKFGDDQIEVMLNLRDILSKQLKELNIEFSKVNDLFEKIVLTQFIDKFYRDIKNLDDEIEEFKKNIRFVNSQFKEINQNSSAIKKFRDAYNINIDNLKKIEGLNSLSRIFEYLDKVKPENTPSIREIYSEIFSKEQRTFNKIFLAYEFLNLIGYYPDESLNKENKFLRSNLDRSHATLGCFCDILVTNDIRFIKKVRVIYEYFNIATQIYNIEVLDNSTSFKVVYDRVKGVI